MTPSRFLIARLAQSFGLERRQRRMSEAASEAHLLHDAEQVLGSKVWREVEGIEELGIEYWNLRRLVADRERLHSEIADLDNHLADAHTRRAGLLDADSAERRNLDQRRNQLLEELDRLAKQRDEVIVRAKELRRLYDGAKTKYQVLEGEGGGDAEGAQRARERMESLRQQFEHLRSERDQTVAHIEADSAELEQVEQQLGIERDRTRQAASGAFQKIGEANRRLSSLKAEVGVVESKMQQLFIDIGRHVSLAAESDPACRAVARNQRSLVSVMSALRKSIRLNHTLSGR